MNNIVVANVHHFERAKVEVHLHQTRIDGTAGQVIIGPGRQGVQLDRDVAAEPGLNDGRHDGGRLVTRAVYFCLAAHKFRSFRVGWYWSHYRQPNQIPNRSELKS